MCSKPVKEALATSPDHRIDILVHNEGHGDDRYLVDIDEEFYRAQMGTNLKGNLSLLPSVTSLLHWSKYTQSRLHETPAPIALTKCALPHMPRGGRIILLSPAAARMGISQQTRQQAKLAWYGSTGSCLGG